MAFQRYAKYVEGIEREGIRYMKIDENKSLHITFSYPYGNGFEPQWVESLTALLLHEIPKEKDKRILGSILKSGSVYVDNNRNDICKNFTEKSYDDWLLMIDPDIQFQQDILEKLAAHIIANPDVEIIAGRVDLLNGFPVFYKHSPIDGRPQHQPFAFSGLKEFDLVGAGILCIRRSALVTLYKKLDHVHLFTKIISTEKAAIGDDFSFCLRARDAGLKIFGAWDIFGIHWKIHPCPHMYPELSQLG